MGKWVLSGAFLLCFLLPGSPVQEHTPISSEHTHGRRPLLASKTPSGFEYTHRTQFPNTSRPCKELSFSNVSESPSDPRKYNAIKTFSPWKEPTSARVSRTIKTIRYPNETRCCKGPYLPTLRRLSGHPSQQILKRPSVNSCLHVPIGSMPLSDKYVNKQTGPMASRKFRKERTVYTKEEQGLLQKHFDECSTQTRRKLWSWHYQLVLQRGRSRLVSLFLLSPTATMSPFSLGTCIVCFWKA